MRACGRVGGWAGGRSGGWVDMCSRASELVRERIGSRMRLGFAGPCVRARASSSAPHSCAWQRSTRPSVCPRSNARRDLQVNHEVQPEASLDYVRLLAQRVSLLGGALVHSSSRCACLTGGAPSSEAHSTLDPATRSICLPGRAPSSRAPSTLDSAARSSQCAGTLTEDGMSAKLLAIRLSF